jgi:HD-like signal output (HDOD) protein
MLDNAFIGGLLHDVGKLIIVSRFPKENHEISRRMEPGGMQRWEAESEIIGASHAEIGAYLLGLWGFSDPIIEAAAFHHQPMVCFARGFSPLTAVHAANAIVDGIEHPNGDQPGCLLNEEYLQELGLTEELSKWQEICSHVTEQKEQKDGTENIACRR